MGQKLCRFSDACMTMTSPSMRTKVRRPRSAKIGTNLPFSLDGMSGLVRQPTERPWLLTHSGPTDVQAMGSGRYGNPMCCWSTYHPELQGLGESHNAKALCVKGCHRLLGYLCH